MKNKVIAFVLAVVICFSSASMAFAENAPVVKEITLSMYANLSDKNTITGVYSNNNFYVSAEDLCEVTDGSIFEQTDKSTAILCNYGTRTITINCTDQTMTDDNAKNIVYTMPVIECEGKRYFSLPHFLRLLDYEFRIDEDTETQLKIYARYNIFDAIGEYVQKDYGNMFLWDQVQCENNKKIYKKLLNAGFVALVNRNSNILKMMVDAKGIEREALEEALITILTNDGVDYLIEDNEANENSNSIYDAISFSADTYSFILEMLKKDIPEDINIALSKSADAISNGATGVIDLLNEIEIANQYDALTETQRTLLEKTLINHSENSAMLQGEWSRLMDAVENVNNRVQSAYENYSKATTQFFDNFSLDTTEGLLAAGNPAYLAWEGALFFTNHISPSISKKVEKKTQLYNAYNCSMIQLISNELLIDAVSDLNEADFMMSDMVSQRSHLNEIKNAMILQLKSTLSTREYLIKSEYLNDDFADAMRQMNKETALLLNKVENCVITIIEPKISVVNYLTWMEKYDASKNEDRIFNDFIKNNIKILDTSKSLFELEIDDKMFSSLIKDFDNDGKKELLTFSIVKTYCMIIRLYVIKNGKVEKVDESIEHAIIGSGNCDFDMCAVLDNNKIKIYAYGCSFGGNRDFQEHILYSVKNQKLILETDLSRYFIGSENYLSLTDNLTEKTYKTMEDFNSAVKTAGFDVKKHPHFDVPTDKTSLNSFSNDHIFVYLCSMNFSGNYKVIYDYTNTSLKDSNISTTNKIVQNNSSQISFLKSHTWYYSIQCYQAFQFKDNGKIILYNGVFDDNTHECVSLEISDLKTYSSYSFKNDYLTLYYDEGETVLKLVTKKDNINWKEDLFFYNSTYSDVDDDELFFYEVDYKQDDLGLGNVTWLRMLT